MNDLKFAFRQLLKNPAFTAVAVLTLALGIGANTAVFSFLDRIFWRPLPVREPRELVLLKFRTETGSRGDAFVYPLYVSLHEQSQEVFSGLIAYWLALAHLSVGGTEAEVPAMAVSSDYFSVLGVKPVLGRAFLPEEDRVPGAHAVAVISHELWQRRMGGDPAVVGQTIRLNERALTVVGVAPARFTGTYAGLGPAVYVPLATWAHLKGISLEDRAYDWLHLIGRLKPGVGPERAQAALRVVAERIHAVTPQNTPTGILVTSGRQGTNVWIEEKLWGLFALLQAVTALVLLIACANVTNLLLARGATRRRELAIRVAVGASRRDLIRQLLGESLLLALISAAGGLLLARWSMQGLRSAVWVASVSNIPVALDGRILLFALGLSVLTALACGLVPALRAAGSDLLSALNEGAGFIPLLTRRRPLRHLLVVVQVAVTMVVLALGALCLRSVGQLQGADPGFEVSRLVAVSTKSGHWRGDTLETHRRLTEVKERLRAMPGVTAVSLAARVPLSEGGRNKTAARHIADFQMPAGEAGLSWEYELVGPGYFQTLGVPIVQGRDFTAQDRPGAPLVMIVNEAMARQLWPNQNPISKRVTFDAGVREVVGVVKAFKLRTLREEPAPLSFWPLDQAMPGKSGSGPRPVLLVRAAGDLQPILSFLHTELPPGGLGAGGAEVSTLPDRLRVLLAPQRMIGAVLNVLGLVGLLFAAAGVFGVMAYEVSQRTREIGIRMALGAQFGEVLRWVLRRGAALAMTGIAFGLALSVVPMALLEAFIPEIRQADRYFLYGVHTWDPLTYALAGAVVMAVGLAACWLPARRAARIDPMVALRYE
ncbi:MAG: ABC transporter permease [Verrucomicrobia bacterium]|nr:ABC transporter permease [Verrucomicrobiota bacterium]